MAQVEEKGVIIPQEVLIRKETGRCVLVMKNISSTDYAFKIKTTHPKSYLVRPCIGVIEHGEEAVIEIELIEKDGNLSKHRFLVQLAFGPRAFLQDNLQRIFVLSGIEKIERRVSVRYLSDSKPEERPPIEKEKSLFALLAVLFVLYHLMVLIRKMIFDT